MSEHLLPGLPPLPPPRAMSDHDWVRLLARIDQAIASYQRRRRVRILALVIVVLLVVGVVTAIRAEAGAAGRAGEDGRARAAAALLV